MDVKPSNIGEESKSPVVSTTVCGDEVGSVMQDNVGSETGLTDIAGLAANDKAVVEMTSAIPWYESDWLICGLLLVITFCSIYFLSKDNGT